MSNSHDFYEHGFASCAVLFLLLSLAPRAWPQMDEGGSSMNVFRIHISGARSCISCHPPHTANGVGTVVDREAEGTVPKGYEGEDALKRRKSDSTANPEVSHTLLCLSCHDGILTPQNMMSAQVYDENVSGLRRVRHSRIASFRDNDAWLRAAEHPVGADAVIPTGNGLQFTDGEFTVDPGSPYARFVASYGWPVLAPGKHARSYGISDEGTPYVLCTTCHNPHGSDVYVSTAESPIAGDGGGQEYVASYSLNGPYNPDTHNMSGQMATSNAQFCRQCHFELSNEANNAFGISTLFQNSSREYPLIDCINSKCCPAGPVRRGSVVASAKLCAM
jgi:hypothetical protein